MLQKQETIDFAAFNIPRSFIFMNHKLRFGGEYRNLQLRFFNRKVALAKSSPPSTKGGLLTNTV